MTGIENGVAEALDVMAIEPVTALTAAVSRATTRFAELPAGMLVGAAFLRDFVGKTKENAGATRLPWIHLDIASTANNAGGAYGFTGAGPTGTTVRSLISFAEALARK